MYEVSWSVITAHDLSYCILPFALANTVLEKKEEDAILNWPAVVLWKYGTVGKKQSCHVDSIF